MRSSLRRHAGLNEKQMCRWMDGSQGGEGSGRRCTVPRAGVWCKHLNPRCNELPKPQDRCSWKSYVTPHLASLWLHKSKHSALKLIIKIIFIPVCPPNICCRPFSPSFPSSSVRQHGWVCNNWVQDFVVGCSGLHVFVRRRCCALRLEKPFPASLNLITHVYICVCGVGPELICLLSNGCMIKTQGHK